jgi:PKD repeat protein
VDIRKALYNDIWRSTDDGATWTQVIINPTWTSHEQNPVHTYTSPGTYTVTLRATNEQGSNTMVKVGYIVVREPAPIEFTFSITNVENYPGNRNLSPFGYFASWNTYYNLHNKAGWRLLSWKNDTDVSRNDFGTQGGGLNDATFHFHFSHGGHYYSSIWNYTFLELTNGVLIAPFEVQKKWGNKNKWVMLSACEILDDPTWGGALNTSHGIFGYKTEVGSAQNKIVNDFFNNAMNQNMTLVESYRNATKYGIPYSSIKNVTAAVIFHNKQQAFGDHLPGYGTVEPDGNAGDIIFTDNWSC